MKSLLRKQILERRNAFPLSEIAEFSQKVCERITELPQFKNCSAIFAYQSFGSEVDTQFLLERAWNSGKKVCIPKVAEKGKMDFFAIEKNHRLKPNIYGILEPPKDSELAIPDEKTMFVVPGVAFDRNGFRIGYGAGFYDIYLTKFENSVNPTAKIGICFDFCMVDNAFPDSHDVPMSAIVTENNVFEI